MPWAETGQNLVRAAVQELPAQVQAALEWAGRGRECHSPFQHRVWQAHIVDNCTGSPMATSMYSSYFCCSYFDSECLILLQLSFHWNLLVWMGMTRHKSISLVLIVTLFYASYEAGLVFPAGTEVKCEACWCSGGHITASTWINQILLLPVLYLLWDQKWSRWTCWERCCGVKLGHLIAVGENRESQYQNPPWLRFWSSSADGGWNCSGFTVLRLKKEFGRVISRAIELAPLPRAMFS